MLSEKHFSLPKNEQADVKIRQAWAKMFEATSSNRQVIATFLPQVLEAEKIRFNNNLPQESLYHQLLVDSQGVIDIKSKTAAMRLFQYLDKQIEENLVVWSEFPQEAQRLGLPKAEVLYARLEMCRDINIY